MWSNFVIAAEAVLPMFIVMFIGMFVRRCGLLNETDVKKLNTLVYHVFFPVLMFSNLYGEEISGVVTAKMMEFAVLAVLGIYGLTVCVVMKIEKNQKTRGAMIQAIYRSNFVIMGIPIVSNIYGGEHLLLPSVMITVIVPIYNVLAVLTLEIFRGGKPSVRHILLQVIKNPLILGALTGLASVLINLKLPEMLESVVSSMSSAATPLALLTLGAFFDLKSVSKRMKDITICVAGRLIVVPFIALTAGILLGFRDIELVTLIAIFTAPSAVSSFPMAQEMGSDAELAGDTVIFSSAFACLTMFLWIFAIKSLGMF